MTRANTMIAHLTSAHSRDDTRIFLKMCRSLASHGHGVTLVVADGKGDERRDGVSIVDAGASSSRLARMLDAPRRVLRRALALNADLYHLHDPELLLIGLALRRRGKIVVYDAHEDFPAALLSKPYLPSFARRPISWLGSMLEDFVGARLSGLIGATPHIRDKFAEAGLKTVNINNYPMTEELFEINSSARLRNSGPVYVGGFGLVRGLAQLVDAMELVESRVELTLAGQVDNAASQAAVVGKPGWRRIRPVGTLSREEVRAALCGATSGVVTFLPEPNHITAQPNKLFEYMSAGLPVIASNFPLWREIVEGNDCGLCVDPLDPSAIAGAIDRLVTDPLAASRMGANGRRAVLERYNWDVEERKLLEFYAAILGAP